MENNGIIIPSLAWPVIDKVYPNERAAMSAAEDDGILPGRFVLIQYCDLTLTAEAKKALAAGDGYYPPLPDSEYKVIFQSACRAWEQNYQIDYAYYLESKEHMLLQKVTKYNEQLQKYEFAYKEIAYLNVPDKTPIDIASYVNNQLVWHDYLS